MGDTEERQEDVQRWTAKRRATLILEIRDYDDNGSGPGPRPHGGRGGTLVRAVSGGCGGSLSEPFRNLEERTVQAGDPQRQRPCVPKPEIPGNVP